MANKYRYIFFDAQIILVTGQHAISRPNVNGGIIKKEDLLRMFMLSVFKVVREVGCDRPFLLWDSSPYHKQAILKEQLGIEDYKGDRVYASADDIPGIETQIKELEAGEHDVEELRKLKNKLRDVVRQVTNFQVRQEVKRTIINDFGDFGFTSIIKSGYEADDFAYLISTYLKDDHRRSLFVTKDSDWDYLLTPKFDVYNNFSRKPEKFKTYEQMHEFYNWLRTDFPEWDLFDLKIHIDCLFGSHNNLKNCLNKGWGNKPMRQIMDNLEEAVADMPRYLAQHETYKFENYPDYEFISKSFPWYAKKGKLQTLDLFSKYLKDNNIKMNPMSYRTICETLNYSEFSPDAE